MTSLRWFSTSPTRPLSETANPATATSATKLAAAAIAGTLNRWIRPGAGPFRSSRCSRGRSVSGGSRGGTESAISPVMAWKSTRISRQGEQLGTW